MDIKFGLHELLAPYAVTGTKNKPVAFTLEDMSYELVQRFKFPPHIVGAALWDTFHKMAHEGLEFKGTDKFGSRAHELMLYLKQRCTGLSKFEVAVLVQDKLIATTVCLNSICPQRTGELKPLLSRWERFKYALLQPRRLFWLPTWRI